MFFVDSKVPDDCVLRISSDWQIGSVTWAEAKVPDLLSPLRDDPKHYRIAFIGDIIDGFTRQNKLWSLEDLDLRFPDPLSQASEFVRKIKEHGVEKQVIGVGLGNHELFGRDFGDVTKEVICPKLKVPYLGYRALVRFNKADKAFLWHGRPSMNSTLPDPVQRRMAILRRLYVTHQGLWARDDAQLLAGGHTNMLAVLPPTFSRTPTLEYDWDAKKIHADYAQGDPRWFAVCGSLQTGVVEGCTPYTEARGFSPLPLGCVDVTLDKGRIVDVKEVLL